MTSSETEFLTLNQLFDAIGIVEKGIEKIYHYLLIHKRIENLKKVCNKYGLTLKRGYKINSVLSDLELVHIFSRPMKIHLVQPVLPAWQKIINNRIQELKNQFEQDKEECENSLEEFIKAYNLSDQTSESPVEFINYSLENFDDLYYPFFAKNNCKLAVGIRYENLIMSLLQKESIEALSDENKKIILEGIKAFKDNLSNIEIQVIFNTDILVALLGGGDFKTLRQLLNDMDFNFRKLEIRITEADFSNFSLVDSNELIQPSFDPTNKLMGAYISRNNNIFQVFQDKFNELFNKALDINTYLDRNKSIPFESLTEFESFILCLL
jgi:sugar-specific transcriptional regulator TrmB